MPKTTNQNTVKALQQVADDERYWKDLTPREWVLSSYKGRATATMYMSDKPMGQRTLVVTRQHVEWLDRLRGKFDSQVRHRCIFGG